MRQGTRIRDLLLMALALESGAVDATTFLRLGEVFVANMTGNTVLLGVALATLSPQRAVRAVLALTGSCSA